MKQPSSVEACIQEQRARVAADPELTAYYEEHPFQAVTDEVREMDPELAAEGRKLVEEHAERFDEVQLAVDPEFPSLTGMLEDREFVIAFHGLALGQMRHSSLPVQIDEPYVEKRAVEIVKQFAERARAKALSFN